MPTPAIPQISVIMPVYNCQDYLALAVQSILSQTVGDFEFLIIDDGSTDHSPKLLQDFARRDRRIKLISRPNTGIVGALNDGLHAARAPLIARMDGDDISLPDRFEKQLAYMNEHPDCVLVGSRVLLIDSDGDPIREWIAEFTHDEIDQAHLTHGWPVIHPTVMMRADAVRAIGGYRDEYQWQEDLDLFLRLAEVGKLANLPDTLLKYRKHAGSVCHQKWREQRRIRKALYEDTYRRRKLDGEPMPLGPVEEGSQWQQYLTWAWWALMAGNIQTARKYARTVFRQCPLRPDSWRVMYCAMRGR